MGGLFFRTAATGHSRRDVSFHEFLTGAVYQAPETIAQSTTAPAEPSITSVS